MSISLNRYPLLKDYSYKFFEGTKKEVRETDKRISSLKEAIKKCGLKDGMTISFHHHFRNGDLVVNQVIDEIAKLGIKNLTLAASSLIDVHSPLIEHIKNGVITRIETSGIRGELAESLSRGLMETPVVFRSHGHRAYAIENGDLKIDVAFLGVPSTDCSGNANGYARGEESKIICGSLGYARVDAQFADKVILLTNHIAPYPNVPCAIPEYYVDYIVEMENIGESDKIVSGATRYTKNPKELLIAEKAADVIEASGLMKDGFSMQMGTGGASLATARFIKSKMKRKGIIASFALGGITEQIVQMHKEGMIKRILDVQSFDLSSAKSLRDNHFHQQISATHYANPGNTESVVNKLDTLILSALEIDINFNVNVLTGSDGVIRGAIGGHPDTAAGAKCTIVVAPLTRGRIPTVVNKVNTIVTPGSTVDVLVTEQGVAVNPIREDLKNQLINEGIEVVTIEELKIKAEKKVGVAKPIEYLDKVVGIVLYRDNTIIDVIHQIKE